MDIDLGLDIWQKNEKISLARINTPELRGDEREAGIKSRDALIDLILGLIPDVLRLLFLNVYS